MGAAGSLLVPRGALVRPWALPWLLCLGRALDVMAREGWAMKATAGVEREGSVTVLEARVVTRTAAPRERLRPKGTDGHLELLRLLLLVLLAVLIVLVVVLAILAILVVLVVLVGVLRLPLPPLQPAAPSPGIVWARLPRCSRETLALAKQSRRSIRDEAPPNRRRLQRRHLQLLQRRLLLQRRQRGLPKQQFAILPTPRRHCLIRSLE